MKKKYWILVLILIGALLVRVWRIDQLLGFYYDQGRDALSVWDLIYNHKVSLIGPTTGIEGIFRGPWYYWLIAPAYFLGQGNPVWPSVFLSFTTVVSVALIFWLGKKMIDSTTGLIAATLAAFSFNFVLSSRWLSNPTPMFLISMLLVASMFLALEKKKYAWPIMGFLVGLAMQFGSAAETFYIPAVIIFAVWQRKKLGGVKTILLSIFAFIVPFIPQIIFDLRHDGILSTTLRKFLFEKESFSLSFWEVVKVRFPFYFDVFNSKIFMSNENYGLIFGLVALLSIFVNRKTVLKNEKFVTLFILFLSPILGMLFFQGNNGNVYDYYFTGYYLVFVLLFSSLLGLFGKYTWGKVIIIVFVFLFLQINLPVIKSYVTSGVDGPNTIAFGNQKEAVDWVYVDAAGRDFNVDVYVPPVIPYAYDYLFNWRGKNIHGKLPSDSSTPLLYTLYEVDPPHPERLEAWLDRQKGIGDVEETVRYGGITVERRHRL